MQATACGRSKTKEIAWEALPIGVVASLHLTNPGSGLTHYEAGVRRSLLHRHDARFPHCPRDVAGAAPQYLTGALIVAAFTAIFFQHWFLGSAVLVLLGACELWEFRVRARGTAVLRILDESRRWKASVLRGGVLTTVSAVDLVPGDIIEINAGEYVPADARIFLADGLSCQKNSFLREPASLPPGIEEGMVHLGSLVLSGRGRAIVIATGSHTLLGSIACPRDASADFADPALSHGPAAGQCQRMRSF